MLPRNSKCKMPIKKITNAEIRKRMSRKRYIAQRIKKRRFAYVHVHI